MVVSPEDVGPLLDGFGVVGVIDGRVPSPVPELNSRAEAGVTGVHRSGHVAPLLGRVRDRTVRARTAPLSVRIADGPASCRNTGPLGASLEHVGIDRHERFDHHGAGRSADCVDAVRVRLVRGDRVLYLVDDGSGVAAAVVREGRRGRHIQQFCDVCGTTSRMPF